MKSPNRQRTESPVAGALETGALETGALETGALEDGALENAGAKSAEAERAALEGTGIEPMAEQDTGSSAVSLCSSMQRWLLAEAGEQEDEAEQNLSLLFRALPAVAPSPELVTRVLAARRRGQRRWRLPQRRPWMGAAALVAIVLAAAGLVWLSASAFWWLSNTDPSDLVSRSAQALASLAELQVLTARVLTLAHTLWQALLTVLAAPPSLLGLAACLLLASLSLRWLTTTLPGFGLASLRSSSHGPSAV